MPYKSMYKSELARAAGVSLKVLNRWLEPHRQQLSAFGVGKYDKMLPPISVPRRGCFLLLKNKEVRQLRRT